MARPLVPFDTESVGSVFRLGISAAVVLGGIVGGAVLAVTVVLG